MREDDNNPFRQPSGGGQDHLWLRQSATFTVNGQTRTVEIVLPVRPGASADEVEALLDEADAGMRRLARRLDAHVAEAMGMGASAAADTAPTGARHAAPPVPAPQQAPSSQRDIAESPYNAPVSPAELQPPSAQRPAATMAPADERSARPSAPSSALVQPPAPAAQPAAQRAPAPAPRPPAPSQPQATPQQAPQPTRADSRTPAAVAPTPAASRAAAPSVPPVAPVSPDGPDLSRAEFLAAANALGFNPKQAMDKLNVRSLNGLNLREALALLQRQSLRAETMPAEQARPKAADAASDGASAQATARVTGATTTPDTRRPTPIRPAARPAYGFDEEDEPDLTFDLPDEPLGDEFNAPLPTTPTPVAPTDDYAPPNPPAEFDDLDDFDDLDELDDLDDLDEPMAYEPVSSPTADAAPTAEAQASDGEDELAQARRIIARLRSARGGGVPVQQQRMAYRNIVIAQLGEPMASALARGVWRITPERLGPEQLDAINQWGKEDAFADEAVMALAALEAERAAQASATPPAAPATAPAQTTAGEQAARPAPRTPARTGATGTTTARTTRPAAPRQADAAEPPPTPRARAPRREQP